MHSNSNKNDFPCAPSVLLVGGSLGRTNGSSALADADGLASISDTATSSAHNFAYAPLGLRVRDQRTGASPHDKRYIYTTAGALMTA